MRHRPVTSRGFTLVEVMLALVICAGLVAAVFAFYSHAVNIQKVVGSQIETVSASRAVMDHITTEFRNAMAFPFMNMGIDGATDHITFITTAIPGPNAWAVRTATSDWIPPEDDLELAGYRLRIVASSDGTTNIVEGMERTSQRIILAEEPTEGREISVSFLTSHVQFLRFRYYDGSNWQDTWASAGALPTAIEIMIGPQPLPDGLAPDDVTPDNYPYQTYRRTVFMPGKSAGIGKGPSSTSQPADDGSTSTSTSTGASQGGQQ